MPGRPAQVISLLDSEHALDGLLDPRSRDLPRLDGGQHGIISVGLLLRRTGDYEQISPGPESLECSLGRTISALRTGHRQVDGDDHPVETDIPA
jgi:hypothetical protein